MTEVMVAPAVAVADAVTVVAAPTVAVALADGVVIATEVAVTTVTLTALEVTVLPFVSVTRAVME